MPDNHGDAVAFGVVLPKQLLVGKLREGFFSEAFVVEKLFLGGGEVGGGHGVVEINLTIRARVSCEQGNWTQRTAESTVSRISRYCL